MRKKDLIALCEKHSDCQFLAFTNATLIDEAFADDMLRVRNFMPAISLEGFESATDGRHVLPVVLEIHGEDGLGPADLPDPAVHGGALLGRWVRANTLSSKHKSPYPGPCP